MAERESRIKKTLLNARVNFIYDSTLKSELNLN